jgi:hypothetical protein
MFGINRDSDIALISALIGTVSFAISLARYTHQSPRREEFVEIQSWRAYWVTSLATVTVGILYGFEVWLTRRLPSLSPARIYVAATSAIEKIGRKENIRDVSTFINFAQVAASFYKRRIDPDISCAAYLAAYAVPPAARILTLSPRAILSGKVTNFFVGVEAGTDTLISNMQIISNIQGASMESIKAKRPVAIRVLDSAKVIVYASLIKYYSQVLDDCIWISVTFDSCLIIIGTGRISLAKVQFVNCEFIFRSNANQHLPFLSILALRQPVSYSSELG